MPAPSVLFAVPISESPLHVKMAFWRKYIGAVLLEFLFISTVCTLIVLSPIARFYVTENEWLLFTCFLLAISYASLLHFSQSPVIKAILMLHILIEALTVAVVVTYSDLMYVYQAILLSTCCLLCLFLFAFQLKWDFNCCVVLFNFIGCACIFSAFLKALLGGTREENIMSIAISFMIIFYHSYAAYNIMLSLTASDYLLSLINVHTLPLNLIVYSSPVYKPKNDVCS